MSVNLSKGDTRLIIDEAKKAGVLRNQLAYMLATAALETNYTMKPVREAYWITNAEAWRKRNLRYYPHYGRGYVQLTWGDNYDKADKALGLGGSLVNDPDRALEPEIAAKVLVHGMMEGWFTGKKLDDYVDLQKSNYLSARKVVNGNDRADIIARLAKEYEQALLDEGYGVDPEPDDGLPDSEDGLRELVKQVIAYNGAQDTWLQKLEDRVAELEKQAASQSEQGL